MKCVNKLIFVMIIGIAFMLIFNVAAYSQGSLIIHDIGKLRWEQAELPRNGVTFPVYPNGDYRRTIANTVLPWLFANQWTHPDGTTESVDVYCQETYGSPTDPISLVQTRRYAPPNQIIDGILLTPPYTGEVDNDLKVDIFTEQLIKC